MAKPGIHVVPNGNKWSVKQEGNPTPISSHLKQETAINAGRPIAQRDQTELVIHRPNGIIRDKDSYGRDPNPPKDKVH